MTSPRTISILGCGWLGLPLVTSFNEAGYTVRGSTTDREKRARIREAGGIPHRIVVTDTVEGEDVDTFFGAEVLVCTIPPGRHAVPYPDRIRTVREAAERHGAGWVLFTSSTSVYPDLDGVVEESDAGSREGIPLRRNGDAVLAAERVLKGSTAFDVTVLRLAGLYGHGRHPARFFAGREGLAGGEAPVNLVHRDDVIDAVCAVLRHDARGTTFNVCADRHPRRREVYPAEAKRLGLDPPVFDGAEAEGYKIVSNARIRERLGFAFTYADPMTAAP